MKLQLTFKPIVLDLPDERDEAVSSLRHASASQRIDFLNENWNTYVDPSLPELVKVEVVRATTSRVDVERRTPTKPKRKTSKKKR